MSKGHGLDLGGGAVLALVAVAGLGVLGLMAWQRGGLGNLAKDAARSIGGAAVDAAGGVITGVVDGTSNVVGLPTTDQTVTDAEAARWLIDNAGQFEASKWAGAPAYIKAQFLPDGSGRPPADGTPAAARFAAEIAAWRRTHPASGEAPPMLPGYAPSVDGGLTVWTQGPTFADLARPY